MVTESEEHLVEAAETAVHNSTAASATMQNSTPAVHVPTVESAAAAKTTEMTATLATAM